LLTGVGSAGGDGSTYAHHMKDARFTIPTPALLAMVKTKKTELLFLALFLRLLKPGGRAAVIVPDGVLLCC
jgi:hypothetical protein